MPNRSRRKAKKTVLIVGEGTTEEAFLNHLKSLYIERGCGISLKIKAATGGSPNCIVRYTISSVANRAYDKVAILMDTDMDWSNKLQGDAKKKRITLIGSIPCIEGLLLKILGETVSGQSADCKSACNRLFKMKKLTEKQTYSEKISKELLE